MPEHPNLLVTRTLSKAYSLAIFSVGYGIFPEAVADDLNGHNDAYPFARPSQAAAIATLSTKTRYMPAPRNCVAEQMARLSPRPVLLVPLPEASSSAGFE